MAGIAISEGVQALVSLATFNFPGAAAHAAAAAAAGAAAVAIAGLVGATGGFSRSKNVKGFDGSAFGEGAAPTANDRQSATNSQDDTVPVSAEEAMQRSGQANGRSGARRSGANVYLGPGSITVLGAIDEQSARKIAVGIKRAGDTGGRLTG